MVEGYQGPVSEIVFKASNYLREIVRSDTGRSFSVYVEPLAGGKSNFRNYGDHYEIVVSSDSDASLEDIRHAFLHFLLDPMVIRYRAQDFHPIQYADGETPGWPFGYEELEPWYGRAEALYQVRGKLGEDPTEPAHSTAYPFSPVPDEPAIAKVRERMTRVGLSPFPLPLGLDLDIEPQIADQELVTEQSTGVIYWEGTCRVGGTRRGRPVTGRAYAELTGYARRDVPGVAP